MSRTDVALSIVILLVPILVVSGGCGAAPSGRQSEATTVAADPVQEVVEPAHGDASGATAEPAAQTKASETPEGLAPLSAQDRELAMKQRVCPVTGESLGSMGTPVKVHILGRDVFLCCAGCEEDLRAKADEYLAKLPK